MIKKENETKDVEVIKDVICNMCGNSCKKHEGFDGSFSFATVKAHWGYFSDNRDGELHEAQICQKCWEDVVKTFKHSDLIATEQF